MNLRRLNQTVPGVGELHYVNNHECTLGIALCLQSRLHTEKSPLRLPSGTLMELEWALEAHSPEIPYYLFCDEATHVSGSNNR